MDNEVNGLDVELVSLLDLARHHAGIPFFINSGFRTPERNIEVGGKEDSAHLLGKAVDLDCKDSASRFKIVMSLYKAGFSRIGIGKTFVHADIDMTKPQAVIWLYDT